MRYSLILTVLTLLLLSSGQAQVEPVLPVSQPPVEEAPRRLASGLGLRSTFLYLTSSGSTNLTAFLGLEYETDLSGQVSLGGDLSLGLLFLGLGVEYPWLSAGLPHRPHPFQLPDSADPFDARGGLRGAPAQRVRAELDDLAQPPMAVLSVCGLRLSENSPRWP